MKLAELMRHPAKDLSEGLGIEGRAIGRDAPQRQVPRGQGGFQAAQKGPDIVMGGGVVQDVIEEALVTAIIDRGENTAGTVIEFIDRHIAREISQGPVEEVGGHPALRVFFPPPPPNFGAWQKARRPAGRATDANLPDGRASRPRPRGARPD